MIKSKTNPMATVLIVTLLLLALYLITNSAIAIYLALTVGLSGLLFNSLADAIHRLWAKLTGILRLVVPNLLLTLVFYLLLTPLAVLAKRFGKKNQLNLRNVNDSLFEEQREVFNKAFFERPW